MLYFYALTSHCGQWIHDAYSRARRWQVSPQLLYGQVKKLYRRRRVQRVEHRAILGSIEQIKAALISLGFSGTIQTALVERFNATLRHGVSTLVRRTCGKAQLVGEMTLHLEWFRAYYHFVHPQGGLREAMQTCLPLCHVPHDRQRTPAIVAGITHGVGASLRCCPFLFHLARGQTASHACDRVKTEKHRTESAPDSAIGAFTNQGLGGKRLLWCAPELSPVFCSATRPVTVEVWMARGNPPIGAYTVWLPHVMR
jgi:hypothetical protein